MARVTSKLSGFYPQQELLTDKAFMTPTHLSPDASLIQEPMGHLGDAISGPLHKEGHQYVALYCVIVNPNIL